MWPFIFILAMIPLAFYWSDSLANLFPQWAKYLPAPSGKPTGLLPPEQPASETTPTHDATLTWLEAKTESGYVAYVLSADNVFRLAAGCKTGAEPSLQVTHISGTPIDSSVSLNYQYGVLPLTNGYSSGVEVVNATAQFETVYLQTPDRVVVAQFTPSKETSNVVARSLAANCVMTGEGR